jgi:hypothetical protein
MLCSKDEEKNVDLLHYDVSQWRKIVQKKYVIVKTTTPPA